MNICCDERAFWFKFGLNYLKVVAGIEPVEALVQALEGPEKSNDGRPAWQLADLFKKLPLSERSVRSPIHVF